MVRRACDGAGLLAAFGAAVANLEAHVDEINALNVYPVPDGDTGSNMYATVRAALEEAENAAGQPVDRVAAAISFGALMGARGNSGVITSQIFRGMAEGLEGKKRFNGLDLAHALATASKTAYAAVAKPVEGTILTVIRESADAAVAAAKHSEDLETVLAATVDAAEKSVARTPTLLAILREAGVVDSGGQGLYRLFQGALLHLVGQTPAATARSRAKGGAKPSALVAHADEGFGYETMFLLMAEGSRSLDVDAIRIHLETIGESVLVAGRPAGAQGPRAQRAAGPGHRLRPDARLAQPDQRREPRQPGPRRPRDASRGVHRPSRPAHGAAGAGAAEAGGGGPSPHASPLGVIAVVSGDGLAAIFRDFGVAAVVQGGQTSNPSTGELLEAVSAVDAREVLILPNNPNVVLAARQVAALADRPVAVVASRNAAEGFAALLALDPTLSAEANCGPMTEAARAIQTLVVTEAVRDATIGGKKVKRGQTIALDPDDGLIAVDGDRSKAVLAAVGALQRRLRAPHDLLRRRRGPRRGRGDGEAHRRHRCPGSRWRSATAASPTTGT